MDNLVLVDPHSDDFMLTPLLYKIFKRKALHKYKYIINEMLDNNKKIKIYLSYESSSFPDKIFKKLPNFIKHLIVKIDFYFWRKINNIFCYELIHDLDNKDVFFFGYKKSQLIYDERFNKCKNIFFHLSHYHTFPKMKCPTEKLLEKIVFCFDNNILNNKYFKKRFPWYTKDLEIITFQISKKFFNSPNILNKENKCCITGTYHSYNKVEADWGIYNRNQCTLHPLRHELAQIKLAGHINSKLSLFKKNSIVNLKNIRQSKYFDFDIVEFYSNYKYACIPAEGTGAIAIGSLEAMARGCKLFLTTEETLGLNINQCVYNNYNGSAEDLLSKIEYCINSYEKIDTQVIINTANNFNEENLRRKFINVIKKY